jgi:fructoselysine 6-kinase
MVKIIGIGDNVVDKYIHMGTMYPGGNALNIAVLGRRYGADTAYLGCLGNDYAGKHIYESLKNEGVDLSKIRILDGENAYAEVTLIEGDRVFVKGSKGVSHNLILEKEDYEFISTFQLAHTSIYSGIEDLLPSIKKANVKISYDFSNDYTEEYLEKALPHVDYVFFSGSDKSDDEVVKFIKEVKDYGVELVLVTRGSKGATLWYKDEYYNQGIIPTDVVDTLGAGDGFISRLLMGVLNNENIKDTLYHSAKEAARVCTYYGAFGYGVDIK